MKKTRAIKIRSSPCDVLRTKALSKLSCFIIVHPRQRTAPINISISPSRRSLRINREQRENLI